jgi:hypothetical protein
LGISQASVLLGSVRWEGLGISQASVLLGSVRWEGLGISQACSARECTGKGRSIYVKVHHLNKER